MNRRLAVASLTAVFTVTACVTTQFDRYYTAQQWTDAARIFTADPSLLDDEDALYRAGVLFGSPGRPTYDPARAGDLLTRLLMHFPKTGHRADATMRLELLAEILRIRQESASRQRELESQIASITADVRQRRERLDSASTQTDALRRNVAHLEAELREREDQLRAVRLELQRLKAIDLKPRRPPP